MDSGRLENVGGAFINVVEDAAVAPNFGIKSRAASVEYPCNRPFAAAEAHLISHRQAGIAVGGIAAHDQFGKARLKHAALNNPDIGSNGEDVGRNAAHLYVSVRAG